MTFFVIEYLVKSITFFFFDIYFIWNNFDPVEIENENRKEPTFLQELSSFVLDK